MIGTGSFSVRWPLMTGWIRLALAVYVAASTACGGAVLENSQESPEALAHAVLDALARRDRTALQRLTLNEAEFREQVWPELPASRPERNLPFTYVWTDLRTKSEAGLAETLEKHG